MEPLERRRLLSAGHFDATFGTAGRASVGFNPPVSADERGRATVVQPDGKVIVVGGGDPVHGRIQLARYNLDGSLDEAFGDGGRAAPVLDSGSTTTAADVALQADGKIVVVGQKNFSLVVVRYHINGTLDTSFDFDGWASPLIAARWIGSGVAIQPDGKIVVSGSGASTTSGPPDMLVVRFDTNGRLDGSFGTGGYARADFGAAETASELAILADGRIGLVGVINSATGPDFAIACFTPGGALDTSFDGDGKKQIDFFGEEDAGRSAVADGNNLVIAGYAYNPSDSGLPLVLARLRPDGSGDPEFGPDGYGYHVVRSFSAGGGVELARQGDGKLVVCGTSGIPATTVARFTADGLIDATFDGDGRASIALPQGPWYAAAVAVAPDGRILAAGTAGTVRYDFAVACFRADGSVETNFGSGAGYITTDFRFPLATRDTLGDVASLPDGRVLLAGHSDAGWTALARLTSTGLLDTTFGAGGRVLIEGGGKVAKLVPLAGGQFLAVGSVFNGTDNDFEVRRFNADGSLDASYGSGGHALTNIYGNDGPTWATLQPDGKLWVAGRADVGMSSSQTLVGVARYNADGSPDVTFDGDGKLLLTLDGSGFAGTGMAPDGKLIVSTANSIYRFKVDGSVDTSFGTNGEVPAQYAWIMHVQPDGKILRAGRAEAWPSFDLIVSRYDADGTPDHSFGSSGVRYVSVRDDDRPVAIAMQPDGKIVLAGHARSSFGDYSMLVRLDAAGNLDATFDDDGTMSIDVGGTDDPEGLAIQPDGAILLGGTAMVLSSYDFHVMRFAGTDDSPLTLSSTGKLTVTGTEGHDGFTLGVSLGQVTITRADGASHTVPQNRVTSILIRGLGGDDVLTYNGTLGRPTTFEGGAGADTLNVAAASTFTFNVDAAASTPSLRINVADASTVVFNASQHLAGLHIASGGTALMPANGSRLLHTAALTVAENAKLELANNDLLLDYTGDSPYHAIRDLVITGRSSGTQGIVTTGTGDTVLAVVDNAQFGRTSWNDQSIDATTIIGKYTYYGDSNLDGKVTGDDYVAIDSNLGRNPGTSQWFHGDFNFDGYVTGDDYVSIDANLGDGTFDPAAYDEDQAEMIALHAEKYGGRKYIQRVEADARGKSRPVPKKALRGAAMKAWSLDLRRR